MKEIVHSSKKDVFSNWINQFFLSKGKKYIWPQLCYDWNTGELQHIVFEKNSKNKGSVEWPVKFDQTKVGITNIDFTDCPPKLDDGKEWDFLEWHIDALGCDLKNSPQKPPGSFHDWRLQTKPQGNLACDLDLLCTTNDNGYIGIEATEIYHLEESNDRSKDCYKHFVRLLTLRKSGFNLLQLKAIMNFMAILDGRAFILLHQFVDNSQNNNHHYRLREDRSMLIELDQTNYHQIERIVKEDRNMVREPGSAPSDEDPMVLLKPKFTFLPLNKIFDRFV